MAILFPDSITQNNSNYITVSATDGDVQGIYFVANTTERDNIGLEDTVLDNHRVLQCLVYVGATPYIYQGADVTDANWQNASNWAVAGSSVNDLDDLGDVTITTATSGDVLYYNGSAWVNTPASSLGATTLGALTDVTETSVASGELLVYTGAGWENQTLAEAGIATDTHTHALNDLSDVVSVSPNAGDVLMWTGSQWTDITPRTNDVATIINVDTATYVIDTAISSNYAGLKVDYVLKDAVGTNIRIGTLYACTDNTSTEITDVSTNSLGPESTIPEFSAIINGSNLEIQITNGNGYAVDMLVSYW